MTKYGSNFQMQMLPLIEAHLKLLQENFEKYFTAEQNATLDANSRTLHPVTRAGERGFQGVHRTRAQGCPGSRGPEEFRFPR